MYGLGCAVTTLQDVPIPVSRVEIFGAWKGILGHNCPRRGGHRQMAGDLNGRAEETDITFVLNLSTIIDLPRFFVRDTTVPEFERVFRVG